MVATTRQTAWLNVDLGDRELYRRLRLAGVESEMTLREIAVEALTYWLDHQEEVEDALAQRKMDRVMAESSGEYVPHAAVKRRRRG